jgi:hypothetical protein
MGDLRERARQNAQLLNDGLARVNTDATAPEPEGLPHIEYTDPIEDIEVVPVHVAWVRVMRDVKSVDKRSQAEITGTKNDGSKFTYKFNYRGIDKVLNAVGPALRRHGVTVIPAAVETTYGNAGRMRECLVKVTYRVIGPDGSHFEMQGVGEGLDVGERATPKALTTAYRNMLITALTIPTEDPKMDPDVVNLEREAPPPPPTAEQYYEEITDPTTSLARLRTIRTEFAAHPDIAAIEVGPPGEEHIALAKLLTRVGKERAAQEATQ